MPTNTPPAPKKGGPADRMTDPLWGFSWEVWAKFAHGFGEGSVTVKSKKRWSTPATAQAVRMWNEAVGMPVFKLVDENEKADIVIKTDPYDAAASMAGFQNHTGAPSTGKKANNTFNPQKAGREGTSHGTISLVKMGYGDTPYLQEFLETLEGKIAHEIGHTVGLDHPTTPVGQRQERAIEKQYGYPRGSVMAEDTRNIMTSGTSAEDMDKRVQGAGGGISVGEANRVRQLLGPQVHEAQQKKKRKRLAEDPTPGPAPGR